MNSCSKETLKEKTMLLPLSFCKMEVSQVKAGSPDMHHKFKELARTSTSPIKTARKT